jgi:hypothetical protein
LARIFARVAQVLSVLIAAPEVVIDIRSTGIGVKACVNIASSHVRKRATYSCSVVVVENTTRPHCEVKGRRAWACACAH